MKLIFLDIDGVLNTYSSLSREKCVIDRDKLELVSKLARKSGAEIVLTSSWRLAPSEVWKTTFDSVGTEVQGITPRLVGGNRKREILAYMSSLEESVEAFVIIDDIRSRCGELRPHLVFINGSKGIGEADISKSERLLTSGG